MSNKGVKPTKERKRKWEKPKIPTRVVIWQALLGFATLIGIPAFVLTVLPRIAVSPPSSPVDPNNVLSVSFEVSNSGLIPLNDVSAKMAIGDIGEGNDPGMHGRRTPNGVPYFDIYFPIEPDQHHRLGLDERFTINPESQLGGYVRSADIEIVASYEPWIIPIHREKRYRFVAIKDLQGNTYWRSWPTDEPPPAH
jgi:hypothetical protein